MRRATLLSLLLLWGCTMEDFALRHVPEGSPSWRYGYADGCHSGRRDAFGRKEMERDLARFRTDDQYREGWRTGYRDCLEREIQEASFTPTVEVPETAVATPAASATPTRAPTPVAAEERAAARRAEIERTLRQLRGEIEALEAELDALPK